MFQSGLYTERSNGIASDKPKPALRAFRFPFVAFRQKERVDLVLGSDARRSEEERRRRAEVWQPAGAASPFRRSIATGSSRAGREHSRKGLVPRRLADGSDVSVPFSLTVPKDFRFCPWGSFC